VQIQSQARASSAFVTVNTVSHTGRRGFLLVTLPYRRGRWRLLVRPSGATAGLVSRVAQTAPR